MSDWVERIKRKTEEHQKEKLYWIERGCCTSAYRKKCVEKGLVPSVVVPMSDKDKEHFRIKPLIALKKDTEVMKPKERGITEGEEYEKVLQKLSREQMKMKLLADIGADMQVCLMTKTDPFEYIRDLIDMLSGMLKKKE